MNSVSWCSSLLKWSHCLFVPCVALFCWGPLVLKPQALFGWGWHFCMSSAECDGSLAIIWVPQPYCCVDSHSHIPAASGLSRESWTRDLGLKKMFSPGPSLHTVLPNKRSELKNCGDGFWGKVRLQTLWHSERNGSYCTSSFDCVFLLDEIMLTLLDCLLLFVLYCSSFVESIPLPLVPSSSAGPCPLLAAAGQCEAPALNNVPWRGHDVGWNWDLCEFLGQTLCFSKHK